MMFTSPMRLLAAVALDTDSDAIAKELLQLGTLEMVQIQSLSGDWKSSVSKVEPKVNLARITEARKRVEGFMAMAVPPISRPVLIGTETSAVDIGETEKRLDSIAAEANGLRERQKSIQDEILKLEEIKRQVEAFEDLKAGAAASSTYSFMTIRAGFLPPAGVEALAAELEGMPSVMVPSAGLDQSQSGVVLVTLKRDSARVEPVLARLGWRDARLPEAGSGGKEEALRGLSSKLDSLRARQAACSDELNSYLGSKRDSLCASWSALRVDEQVAKVRASFSKTERTVLFSGWIPGEKAAAVEAGIRRAAKGGCGIEWCAICPSLSTWTIRGS